MCSQEAACSQHSLTLPLLYWCSSPQQDARKQGHTFQKTPHQRDQKGWGSGRGVMVTFNAAFPAQNHRFLHQLDLGMETVCFNLKAFVIKKEKN